MKGDTPVSLNDRLKEVTLKITLHHLLRNTQKSVDRTSRNIIALGKDLSSEAFAPELINEFQNELKVLLSDYDEEQVKKWLVLKFHL